MTEFDETFRATRIITLNAGGLERAVEAALRPKRLSGFVGQQVVYNRFQLVLDTVRGRAVTPDHMLLAGPPGLGKTTSIMIIVTEMGTSLHLISGPVIQHAGDFVTTLSGLQKDDVLFIDEVHRLARIAEEMLYLAMEDSCVDVVVDGGPGAASIPLTLPPFTITGATARSGLLLAPLRDRFSFTACLEFYTTSKLESIVTRSVELLGVPLDAKAAHEIAPRSCSMLRVVNHPLRRIVDYTQVRRSNALDLEVAQETLELFEMNRSGPDHLDRAVLEAIYRCFAGGPVGLITLAVTVGEKAETVGTVAEPYLAYEDFLVCTNRGYAAAGKAWAHPGLTSPQESTLFG